MKDYYEDAVGLSPRWGRPPAQWVKVLPVPNRHPQDMEMLELQQVSVGGLHNTVYEVVNGLRATVSDGKLITISEGIIWCAIGSRSSYIYVPGSKVTVPPGAKRLGIDLGLTLEGAGYDPILGGIAPLLWDTPLDRLSISVRYAWDKVDTLPVLALEGGRLYYYNKAPNPMRDSLLKTYMRELDGDYIATGLCVVLISGWLHVGAGRAWINGTLTSVQPQSIPYREGTLYLCSDGSVGIEALPQGGHNYLPSSTLLVSSTDTPILIGQEYGVVMAQVQSYMHYLPPQACVPLAHLAGGGVVDIAPRLPSQEELLSLFTGPTISVRSSQQVGDPNHPLYTTRMGYYHPSGQHEPGGIIYLPRVEEVVTVEDYVMPYGETVLEESTVRTDWVDSSPTPSTPPPPPPFLHVVHTSNNNYKVRGYNLVPGASYTPSPTPSNVYRGTLSSTSLIPDTGGMVEYDVVSIDSSIQLSGGVIPTTTPNLSLGLGQGFQVSTPTMVSSVSLYLKAGYQGVVSLCALQGGQPCGPALAWVGVSLTTTGWVDISIGPVYLAPGTYALISQSVVGSVLGRRHYLLPALEGYPETAGSMCMLLSQDGVWQALPNMDLMYRIHQATPITTYKDRQVEVSWPEAFDGYEYRPNYQLPPGTYITCTAKGGSTPLGKAFPPRTSLTLVEAFFSTSTLLPTAGRGEVSLYITSTKGTWISREHLVGTYTGVLVNLRAYIPEGTSVGVHVSAGGGWLSLGDATAKGDDSYSYQVGDLSPTTSLTDINGGVREVLRDRLRVRIELSTLSPEIQPRVWDVSITAIPTA